MNYCAGNVNELITFNGSSNEDGDTTMKYNYNAKNVAQVDNGDEWQIYSY